MSHTLSIDEASTKLGELVRSLAQNDEIVLTENDKPVARILPSGQVVKKRIAGTCRGMLEILDDSDDLILDHFKEYLP